MYRILILDNAQKGTLPMNTEQLINAALFIDGKSVLHMTHNGYQAHIVNPDLIETIVGDSDITIDQHLDLYRGWSCIVHLPNYWLNSLTWRQPN